jgi:hypothetical protein
MSTASKLVAVLVVVLAPTAAAAPISKTTSFVNHSRNVRCGIEIHAPSKPATEVLCSRQGNPRSQARRHRGRWVRSDRPARSPAAAAPQPELLRRRHDCEARPGPTVETSSG